MSNKRYTAIQPPTKVSDWNGSLVRTKRDMQNGFVRIPAGTILAIDGPATSKKHLKGESCPHCGIAPKITIKGDRGSFLADVEFVKEVEVKSFPITCSPKEGYVVVPRDEASGGWREDDEYVVIRKNGTQDELWLVCLRGEMAGHAVRESTIDGSQWMAVGFDAFAEMINVYYVDFGGYGDHKYGPVDSEKLAELIDEYVFRDIDNEINPIINVKCVMREQYLREAGKWDSVYDRLREDPEQFMERFHERQAAKNTGKVE